MKKSILIFALMVLVSLGGFAKKSRMDQQLQETVIQDLNQSLYGVTIKGGIYADHQGPVWLTVKNAGESEIVWDKCLGGIAGLAKDSFHTLVKGVPVILEKVQPKKWGFRLSFRTMEKFKYDAIEIYYDIIKVDGKEKRKIKKERSVKKSAHYFFNIDYKFNEEYYANTPENSKFIHDTFAQGFVFLKSKEDVLVYLDSELGSDKMVEIGMSVEEVIARLGFPDKKIKFKNKMVYKYPDWVLKFEDGKVIAVDF